MASIRDVAKRAGVAVSTVSKVLKHYPNVSEDTVARVLDAVRELDYVPNAIASSLSSKQPARIALLVNLGAHTQATDEITMRTIAGAVQSAQELGLDIVPFFFSMFDGWSVAEVERTLRAQNVGGVVICGLSKDDKVLLELAERGGFRTVVIDAPLVGERLSGVGVDQKQAQMDVARKTITENRGPSERVLYLSGRKDGFVSAEREQGMRKLAKELGLQLRVRCGDFRERKAREITLACGDNFDIIVCASDLMAIGAMRALTEMDVFHPVCGFDGITLMGYAGKQMNTVRQNFREIGAEAVAECARLLAGGTGRRVVLPHELVRLEYQDIIV